MVKNPPANVGDTRDGGSILGLGRSSGAGNGNLFQYACLETFWQATVHGGLKEWDTTKHEHTHVLRMH